VSSSRRSPPIHGSGARWSGRDPAQRAFEQRRRDEHEVVEERLVVGGPPRELRHRASTVVAFDFAEELRPVEAKT
jgi:hypothetical protein